MEPIARDPDQNLVDGPVLDAGERDYPQLDSRPHPAALAALQGVPRDRTAP